MFQAIANGKSQNYTNNIFFKTIPKKGCVSETKFIIGVFTYPQEFYQRDVMRKNWTRSYKYDLKTRVIFFTIVHFVPVPIKRKPVKRPIHPARPRRYKTPVKKIIINIREIVLAGTLNLFHRIRVADVTNRVMDARKILIVLVVPNKK